VTIQLHAPGPDPVKLAPVRPSAGVRAWYEKQLTKLVGEMFRDVASELVPLYSRADREGPITWATFPHGEMNHKLSNLEEKWVEICNERALSIAFEAVYMALRHHDLAFADALKKVGIQVPPPTVLGDRTAVTMDSIADTEHIWRKFAVKFDMTDRLKQTIKNQLKDNVDLISNRRIKDGPSIPKKAFGEIRKMAKESIEKGRDVVGFTKNLEDRFGVTRRRAALIARDQNNKMTALFHRTRQLDCGITEAEWQHTGASLHPREEHEDFDGQSYPVDEGHDFDDGFGLVLPGEAINCGCLSSSIIPGYRSVK
jgi:hypothetical protein